MPLHLVYQHTIADPEAAQPQGIDQAPVQPRDLELAYARVKDHINTIQLDLSDSDIEQIAQLYNATVADGRYIQDFTTDPKSVAERLGMSISDSGAEAIQRVGGVVGVGATPQFIVVVAVAIVVIFIIVQLPSEDRVVIDSSGIIKL